VRIIWAEEASEDFEQAITFIAADNRLAATKLAMRVLDRVEKLATDPIVGPEFILQTGEVVRGWPVRPLRIYYQRDEKELRVVRVYHQSREPITR
jgi:plasmid stabilization system protein ParE